MIEFVAVHKTFGSLNALDDIHLFIQEGEIFGMIGRSGAGKSTLLRTINLLERPDCGQVIVDQKDMAQLSPHDLRQARHKIGMIFQHFNLTQIHTVYDNIALPMRIQGMAEPDIAQKLEELLDLVELTDKQHHYPSQLSGGQKQRVAIARALSSSPKLLLCDEATSALDPQTTESILDLLKKINRVYGITIVLITHEMDVVKRICHRIGLMEAGKLIEVRALDTVFSQKDSQIKDMLYNQLSPKLPPCLNSELSMQVSTRPVLKLLFQDNTATLPFISQTSRELNLDINILLANIDRYGTTTCGVLVVELNANTQRLHAFIERAEHARLHVEILGYVTEPVF